MIVITLKPAHETPDDVLGRKWAGYEEGWNPAQIWDAGRGTWVLGARASRERYALLTFRGEVKLAAEITRVYPTPDGRYAFAGNPLEPGHPVHDTYVGKPSPVRVEGKRPSQNPVAYFDAPEDVTPCLCGCGESLPAGKDFVTGHDQTALYERVKQVGTVKEFIDWFDAMRAPFMRQQDASEVTRMILSEAPEEFTLYQLAGRVNQVLEAMGSEKTVRPQMMYNYARNGMIVKGVRDLKSVTRDQAVEFVTRYVNRTINSA